MMVFEADYRERESGSGWLEKIYPIPISVKLEKVPADLGTLLTNLLLACSVNEARAASSSSV